MKPTLFVSDLHLAPERPRGTEQFFGFLAGPAAQAHALYVLGDLFEYWVGDDDLDDPFNRAVAERLAALSRGGTALFVMHGNRDFLLGPGFCAATGARLLADPALAAIDGTPTLLMHGDLLCTGDLRYQLFRSQVRDPDWQKAFLARTLAERKATVDGLRRMSEAEVRAKAMDIMDVAPDAVADALRRNGYPRLIHGHTHRPGRHLHRVDGHECERWVLPDWYESGGYLLCDANGCRSVAVNGRT